MDDTSQRLDIGDLECRLGRQCHLRRARYDKVGLDIAVLQQFEQPHAVDRAGRSADNDDQAFARIDRQA